MDIVSRLEKLPAGRFHYRLLLIAGLGWLFDAMDTGLIAFVIPTLVKDWGLTPTQIGLIGSIGLLGMALGAVVSGKIADKIGRKSVFAATLVMYSVATGLCGLSWNLESLLVFRFLVGFGLGGQLPVAVTLVSEYAPAAVRGRFIVLLESFWGAGWLVAALIAFLLIPRFGWHMAFFLGALPALYVFYVWKQVPESVPFLVMNGRAEEAHAIVSRLEREAGLPPVKEMLLPPTGETAKLGFATLWQPRFVRRTLMLWLIWFGIVYAYYGIFTWLPQLMVSNGHTIIKSFEYVLIMTLAQLPGYFAAAMLVDKIGRKATLSGFLAACAVCAWLFGHADNSSELLLWGCMMTFFNLGAWGVLYTYTPEQYPAQVRAFGSGWAAAIGRVGGILAPMVVAKIIVLPDGFGKVFGMFTGVLLVVAVLVMVMGQETRHRSLSETDAQ